MQQRNVEQLFAELEEAEDGLLDATLDDGSTAADIPQAAADDSELSGGFRAKLALTPRAYQEEALAAWLGRSGQGVVVLPTGAGKTVLALMAIERLKLQTLIVVPTIELLYQGRDAVVDRLGVAPAKVGVVGDGRKELRPITIITYASAAMPDAPIAGTGLLICDEAHHLPSPSYSTIPRRCGAPYRLGVTATPDRSDGAEGALDRLLGPVVYSRTPQELSEQGHLAKFKEKRIYVDMQPEEALRYGVLMTEWKWFVAKNRAMLARGGDFFGELIRRSGSDPAARAALRAHHQARMIALNAEAKLGVLADLLAKHRADKVLIFSEYNLLVDTVSRELALPCRRLREAPTSLVLRVTSSYSTASLCLGRMMRPSRWMCSRAVLLPLSTMATLASGTSTPSFSTRPATSLE